ncbi:MULTISPECIES: ABC transporter ATP-binding protein [Cereibacter]|uniref:iron ABC transporter ATP-binding protein n=1 Tax=Cereibacter TaxID=1653176 RepID=UPI000C6CB835|nr:MULTISPECIES: ATP-binding cassette domain-containing protein [Cereibacter]
MIEIEDVSHHMGPARILDRVTTRLPRGRLTALIGPNGAGKSTLLNLVARLLPLSAGRIRVEGMDVSHTPSHELALRMAVLGQETSVSSRLRVRELVGFGRWPHHRGRPSPADAAAVEEALAAFDLASLAGRFLDELSGGQRQRAFVAMAFAQGTDWLLLDEPLNNLDMAHARALLERLRAAVRDGGKSAVLVVHEVNYAAAWADHIVALRDGRILAEGTPAEVLTPAVLRDLYGIDIAVGEHAGRPLVLHHA